jgi:putative phage-type endonuclease
MGDMADWVNDVSGEAYGPDPQIERDLDFIEPGNNPKRGRRITSSRIAGIVGLCPYREPYDIWLDVTKRVSFSGNKATRVGQKYERPTAEIAAEELGLTVHRAPFRVHPDHPWAGDSMDFVLKKDGEDYCGAEVKTHGSRAADGYGEEGTDCVPHYVMAQCQWHLAHWPEFDKVLCPMLSSEELRVRHYWVNRDQEFIDMLLERAERFYFDHVVADSPPPLRQGHSAKKLTSWLHHRYQPESDKVLEASDDVTNFVTERNILTAEIKDLQGRLDDVNAKLRCAMGDAAVIEGQGFRVKNIYIQPKEYKVKRDGYWRMDVRPSKQK